MVGFSQNKDVMYVEMLLGVASMKMMIQIFDGKREVIHQPLVILKISYRRQEL